jgi:hypothetical protein
MDVSATLVTLANHVVAPESPSNCSLVEGTPWKFELVHRAIRPAGQKIGMTRLVMPPGFEAVPLKKSKAIPLGFRELEAEDIRYQITLKNQDIGTFKENFRIEDDRGESLLDVPVLWQRLPFLSTSPTSVLIGQKAVRVFLRCPDSSIELVRVVSQPKGINALVTSTQEITVHLADDAPGIISDQIEVETTAKDRPNLTIPIVRYAPSIQSNPISSPSP